MVGGSEERLDLILAERLIQAPEQGQNAEGLASGPQGQRNQFFRVLGRADDLPLRIAGEKHAAGYGSGV